jgi:glutamate-1-semialdehyde aminotransferase
MEPQRSQKPNKNFLNIIRRKSRESSSILIFDEITSGFHDNFGGIHLKLKTNPDIAVFSKALGNGTPIAAIIGKKRYMDYAQETFISSTMWSERIGFVAALATLKKMKEKKVHKQILEYGNLIRIGWEKIFKKHNILISIGGLKTMPSFDILHKNKNEIITFFTEKMLEKGFLASNSVTLTLAHNKSVIYRYLAAVDLIFGEIKNYIDLNQKIPLTHKPRELNFKRLT